MEYYLVKSILIFEQQYNIYLLNYLQLFFHIHQGKLYRQFHNNISEIDIFRKIPFKILKCLDLSNNRIKSIKPFENLKFQKILRVKIKNNLIDLNLQKNINIIKNLDIYIRVDDDDEE